MKREMILLVLLFCSDAASADCAEARDHYRAVVEEVREYLGRYVECVVGSNGLDDCASEFQRLRNAQDEFQKAVEEFRAECP
jgi:hypothetical protein